MRRTGISTGFSMLVAYTFSKMLTDAGSRTTTNFGSPGIQDSNNLLRRESPRQPWMFRSASWSACATGINGNKLVPFDI
jgi:hypothetical protein